MRRAVLICPGRGTYGAGELGYLQRYHSDKSNLIDGWDAQRVAAGQDPISALDKAAMYRGEFYSRGDVASALIYACGICDARALADDIEVVAVTGNSMGWYTALTAAGVLTAQDGFEVVNTMGTLMQEHLIGGQLIYPFVGTDWRDDPARKAELLALVTEIGGREQHSLSLSIDLGGMLVLAGNSAGLAAFEAAVPRVQDRFPMRLPNHAGFHSPLQAPVAEAGRARLHAAMFGGPSVPLIDGRGQIWWPRSSDADALWDYTLGHQVVETYDFSAAIATAALEFAPDLFIVAGPGTTLNGAVCQALILAGWRGLVDKAAVRVASDKAQIVVSMGDARQRDAVTG